MVARMVAVGMGHKSKGAGAPGVQPQVVAFGKADPAFISYINHVAIFIQQQSPAGHLDIGASS
jgi:hypothetical protein